MTLPLSRDMSERQVAVLNSLVTFAAENVPGGLSDEEDEVAFIVGRAALKTIETLEAA